MNNFGVIKNKLLSKLTESYSSKDKSSMRKLLNLIEQNKDFKTLYLFYEDIENKYIEDKDIAKKYVDELSNQLNKTQNNLNEFCNQLDKKLGTFQVDVNPIYETLDQLSESDNLYNIDKKLIAKKKLFEHVTTKKQPIEKKSDVVIQNESLLHAILTNNFNVVYNNSLSEDQKNELKNILSLNDKDVLTKTSELKENILTTIDKLLKESNDNELHNKLNLVRDEVKSLIPTRYTYYKLVELKEGLN